MSSSVIATSTPRAAKDSKLVTWTAFDGVEPTENVSFCHHQVGEFY